MVGVYLDLVIWNLLPWGCLFGGTVGFALVTVLWGPNCRAVVRFGNSDLVRWWYTRINTSESGKKNWENWKNPTQPPLLLRSALGALAAAEVAFAVLFFFGP
jgi:hypothetical protein